MQVVDRATIRLRVWERGAGETLACGTGACAAVVAGVRRGLLDAAVRVHARGGELAIAWAGAGPPVMMTGPAATVFEGEWRTWRGSPRTRCHDNAQSTRDNAWTHRPSRTTSSRIRSSSRTTPTSSRRSSCRIRTAATRSRSPSARSSRCARRTPNSRPSSANCVTYGTENDQISEKVHRSTLALFAAPDLETTLAVLYHSLKEDFGVPQVAARLWGKVPEQSYLPELRRRRRRCATTPISSGSRTAARRRRSSRANGSTTARDCSRSPSCRCAPRTRSACWHSAARRRSLPCGNGHAVPDAPRRTRERGHRALPAAGVGPGRSSHVPKRAAVPPDTPTPSAANPRRCWRFATHLGTRSAHTRSAYLRDVTLLAMAAGEHVTVALRRASLRASSRRCTREAVADAALPACFRRGARSFASCASPTAGWPKIRPPAINLRSRRAPALCTVARRGGTTRGDWGRRHAVATRSCAVRACVFVRAAAVRNSQASTSIASTSPPAKSASWARAPRSASSRSARRRARARGWLVSARGDAARRRAGAVRRRRGPAGGRSRNRARLAAWALRQGLLASRASAHAAALVRFARAAVVGRSPRGAGDAGPRVDRQHAGLYAPRLPGAREGV